MLGAGFGFRQLARSMLDFIPFAGWLLQSAIAYAGTRAVGTAAVQYFEHGAVADVSNVRAFAEGARVELRSWSTGARRGRRGPARALPRRAG